MRYSSTLLGAVAFCVSEVAAFPAVALEYAAQVERDTATARDIDEAVARYEVNRRTVPFNAAEQYVCTHGPFTFVAPNFAAGDVRGPCPGLNAMANHGYISHNGVANIQQFIDGTYKVFGMGKDLGAFLAMYGAVVDGNGDSWSIGGPTPKVPSIVGLVGQPQGLTGSHNKYEGDVSPTRPDLYQYGNNYKVIIPQFQQMFDTQPNAATANYDLSVLTPFRASRFQQSISQNPSFFNGPFTGLLVQPAAYTFIYRFMANKSAEYPQGRLNQEVLKSFFSITGQSGKFIWTEGYERIPENWYKRALGDEYTIPFFLTDVLAAAVKYPRFLSIGGNTGKVNTFTGVDLKILTAGAFDGATLLQGNNLQCFVFQLVTQAIPDVLKGTALGLLNTLTAKISNAAGNVLAGITCPKLQRIQNDQFAKFPGAK